MRKHIRKTIHDENQSICKTTDLKMKKTSHAMFDASSLYLNAL